MSQRNSVAIVDDDPSVRIATESLLRSCGMSVSSFPSAQEFLASLASRQVDCLITDVQMDGMGGAELFQLLLERGDAPPVIFITAFPDSRVRDRVMAAGAICFLAKPFEGQALVDCVERALAA